MFHTTIIAIESDTPLFTDPGLQDESHLLARAFLSRHNPTVFNCNLIYLYDIYSYYLDHIDEALDDFRATAIRANPERKEVIEKMKIRVMRYFVSPS